jgi:hypothetical protein
MYRRGIMVYCKRPIQYLVSSEILTPHPPNRPASVYPSAFGAGGHICWVERGWGVNSSEDARHCSVLYMCKYLCHVPAGAELPDAVGGAGA